MISALRAASRSGERLRPALVAAFAAGAIVLAVTLFVLRATSPWDGTEWQPFQMGNAVRGDGWLQRPVGAVSRLLPTEAVTHVEGQPVGEVVRSPFEIAAPAHPGPLTYDVTSAEGTRQVVQPLAPFPLDTLVREDWAALLTMPTLTAIAVFVFLNRPRDPAAQLLLMTAAAFLPGTFWRWIGVNDLVSGPLLPMHAAFSPLYFLGLTAFGAFAFVYPRPMPWLVRHRRPAAILALLPSAAAALILVKAHLGGEPAVAWFAQMGVVESATMLGAFGLIAAAIPIRLLTLPDRADRRRYALLMGGLGGVAILWVILWLIPSMVIGQPLLPWSAASLLAVPIVAALGWAVLRLGAFEMERIVNRTLVYGVLTAGIALVYVVLVGGTVLLVRDQFGFAAALVATAIVVLLAQPVRDALQRAINRLMYGDRDDPYRALAHLGERIETSLAPREMLAAVVDSVSEALKVPYVAIEVEGEDGTLLAEARGNQAADTVQLPLVHQGERVGQLLVAPRDGGPMSNNDRRLLTDLARQASPAAYAVGLNLELQRSRERLVATREEERRQLRRELHDGLGPALAGSRLQLQAAQAALANDPARAREILRDLEAETSAAVREVRRIARDLRPSSLDELGLIGALRGRAAHFSADGRFEVEVVAPEDLPPLPAAVETAAYLVALEALANVVHHARAHSCAVRIELDGDLQVEIRDDGVGMPWRVAPGVGLRSMRERAAELGGSLEIGPNGASGTAVVARLPIAPGRQ